MRFIIYIAIIHELPSIPIYCILAFPQAELYVDVFMDINLGMAVGGNRKELVLKLNKSLYVINKPGLNWFDLLKNGLERRVYHQYQVYSCEFYRKVSYFNFSTNSFLFPSTKIPKVNTCLYPSWTLCGCLYGYYFRNGSWQK